MRAVGWRVRLLGSGEGEGRAVFLCSCVLAAHRGRLRGYLRHPKPRRRLSAASAAFLAVMQTVIA